MKICKVLQVRGVTDVRILYLDTRKFEGERSVRVSTEKYLMLDSLDHAFDGQVGQTLLQGNGYDQECRCFRLGGGTDNALHLERYLDDTR